MISDTDIVAMIIAAEGTEFTDDPLDAGGATKFGITWRELSAWRERPVTSADVAALEQPEAEAIYRMRYLKPFAALPDGLRQNVTDMGVNAGIARASKLCQQLIGADVDGNIGPSSVRLAKVRDWTEPYTYMRIAFYESLIERKPSQEKYRRGWRARALRFVEQPTAVGRSMLGAFLSERVGKAYEIAA